MKDDDFFKMRDEEYLKARGWLKLEYTNQWSKPDLYQNLLMRDALNLQLDDDVDCLTFLLKNRSEEISNILYDFNQTLIEIKEAKNNRKL